MNSCKNHEQISIILLGKLSQNKKFIKDCGGEYVENGFDDCRVKVTILNTPSMQFKIASINLENVSKCKELYLLNKNKVDVVIYLGNYNTCYNNMSSLDFLKADNVIDFGELQLKGLSPLQCLKEVECCFAANEKKLTILSAHLFDSCSLFSDLPKELVFKISGEHSLVSSCLFFSPSQSKEKGSEIITHSTPLYGGR